jgi:hypothetical protein
MAALGIRKNGEKIAMKLALTDRERRVLKRFMVRIARELEGDRDHLPVDGPRDALELNLRDQDDARAFISRL